MSEQVAEVDTPQETEVAADGTATPEATPAPVAGAVQTGAAKPKLPEGVVSPIAAQNHLKTKGLMPQEAKPQQMYGYVKSPGAGEARFPVAHYMADGTTHEAPVVKDGVTITRPGVILAEVETWWANLAVSRKQKAEAKQAKADAKKAADAAKAAAPAATTEAVPAESIPVDDAGESVEAE
jgi:hypothetical protein